MISAIHTASRRESARKKRSLTRLLLVVALHVLAVVLVIEFAGHPQLLRAALNTEAIRIAQVAILPQPRPPEPPRQVARRETIPEPLMTPPITPSQDAMELQTSKDLAPVDAQAPLVEGQADGRPKAAPAEPAPVAPVDLALICPQQTPPEMPRKALIDRIQGLVRAEATVKDGSVTDVRLLAGPRVFYDAVRAAMMQYKCSAQTKPVLAVQEFNFRIN